MVIKMFVLSFLALLVSCSNENKNSNEKKLEECRMACDTEKKEFREDGAPEDKARRKWIKCLESCKLRYGK